MPRLFNSENCLFQTCAVASLTSNATATGTFTGLATTDYVLVLQNDDLDSVSDSGVIAAVSAADTLLFQPGTHGAGSTPAQTVGVLVLVNPTSGENGGSW